MAFKNAERSRYYADTSRSTRHVAAEITDSDTVESHVGHDPSDKVELTMLVAQLPEGSATL